MAYVNPDSLIMLPDGSVISAAVLAAFGGASTNAQGQVQVNSDTQVLMPGGGSMTAGAIEAFSTPQPTQQTEFPPGPGNPATVTGDPTRGFAPSERVQPPTQSAIDTFGAEHTAFPPGGLTQTRTFEAGTPGAFVGTDPTRQAPGDIPEWARQAFFGAGLTFGDFGRGVQGGTNGRFRINTSGTLADGSTIPVGDPRFEQFETVTPGTGGTAQQSDAFAGIKAILEQAGLGGLAGWAWEQIVNGDSADELYVKLRQTEPWKQRFGAVMTARQKAALPAMSEAEIMAYEASVRGLFRSYGLPQGFYDQADDIAFLAGQNLSIGELNDRITKGFAQVEALPVEVRDWFRDFYGPGSEPALAAMFLDPDKSLPVLERNVAASTVGGVGRRFGFEFGGARAEQLAALGVDTLDEAQAGFGRLDQVKPLLAERLTEKADLTPEGAGADFAFGVGPTDAIRGRLNERVADFSGSASAGTGFGRSGSTLGSATTPGRRA